MALCPFSFHVCTALDLEVSSQKPSHTFSPSDQISSLVSSCVVAPPAPALPGRNRHAPLCPRKARSETEGHLRREPARHRCHTEKGPERSNSPFLPLG